MAIIRPLEVLAEEWLALRKAGVKTPAIAAWPTAACGGAQDEVCMGSKADGSSYAMWRWVLDEFCELTRPSSALSGSPLMSWRQAQASSLRGSTRTHSSPE